MTSFVERAIARAGLLPILTARRAGDLDVSCEAALRADLLVLGAVADIVRREEVGDVVRVHTGRLDPAVTFVSADTDLDLLRAVAVARVTGPRAARIGVDWSKAGLELAQVALGFGASELSGPITRKSGLVILEDEARKVKGRGMVALSSIKKREIAALVASAGRAAVFVEDEQAAVAAGAEGAHA